MTTALRRTIQAEYNEKHGITPQSVRRAVQESLHVTLGGKEVERSVLAEDDSKIALAMRLAAEQGGQEVDRV